MSGWQPSARARSRATWATSRLWVSRLRTKSSDCGSTTWVLAASLREAAAWTTRARSRSNAVRTGASTRLGGSGTMRSRSASSYRRSASIAPDPRASDAGGVLAHPPRRARDEEPEPHDHVDHGVPRQFVGERRSRDLRDAEHRGRRRDPPHRGVLGDRDEDVAEEGQQRQARTEDLHGVLAGHEVADEDPERGEDQRADDRQRSAADPRTDGHVRLALHDPAQVDHGDRDAAEG